MNLISNTSMQEDNMKVLKCSMQVQKWENSKKFSLTRAEFS